MHNFFQYSRSHYGKLATQPTAEVSHSRNVSNCEAIRMRDFRLPLRYRSRRRSSVMSQLMLVVAYRRFGTSYRSLLQVSSAFGRLDLKMGPSVNNINITRVITQKNEGLLKCSSITGCRSNRHVGITNIMKY